MELERLDLKRETLAGNTDLLSRAGLTEIADAPNSTPMEEFIKEIEKFSPPMSKVFLENRSVSTNTKHTTMTTQPHPLPSLAKIPLLN